MKSNKQDPFKFNQEKIAIQTLAMNPIMAGMLGGPTIGEAVNILIKMGYTENEIVKLTVN